MVTVTLGGIPRAFLVLNMQIDLCAFIASEYIASEYIANWGSSHLIPFPMLNPSPLSLVL